MTTRREVVTKCGAGLAAIIAAGKAPAAFIKSMCAARNALLSGGAKLSAKSYVQDGLVAMWDGIENAGWGVHDASATTWTDLIGGITPTANSTLTWGDDCINLAGNKYLSFTSSDLRAIYNAHKLSLEFVVNPPSNQNNIGVFYNYTYNNTFPGWFSTMSWTTHHAFGNRNQTAVPVSSPFNSY